MDTVFDTVSSFEFVLETAPIPKCYRFKFVFDNSLIPVIPQYIKAIIYNLNTKDSRVYKGYVPAFEALNCSEIF